MAKPILSPSDVSGLVSELYALPDSELLIEADAISLDFVGWMDSHFDLTTEQYTYIDQAPDFVKKYWGYAYAAVLLTRGPVTFGAMPANPPPRRIKELRHNMFGDVVYDDDIQEMSGGISLDINFSLR